MRALEISIHDGEGTMTDSLEFDVPRVFPVKLVTIMHEYTPSLSRDDAELAVIISVKGYAKALSERLDVGQH